MEYVRLGNSGLKVSKIILGCMTYGSPEWNKQSWILEEKTAMEHIRAAYEAGINTFDTAAIYSYGLSEVVLGKAIKELELPRDEIVVMTKLFGALGKTMDVNTMRMDLDQEGYVNQHGLSRKNIFASVKASLERLQLDYIDLYQCHRFDPNTPIEETMQALHDIVQAGYVRYIGMSSCWAWQFHAMQNYAITNKLTPFISMQNHYSLVYREEEREMMPTLKHFGVGSIPWSPLARGFLTRPYVPRREDKSDKSETQGTTRNQTDWFIAQYTSSSRSEGNLKIVNRVEEIAKKRGVSMAQIALAWIMGKKGVAAPIIGTTNLDNLKDLLGAISIRLTEEEVNYLEEPYQPQTVLGHV